jgi:hypothetical protein
MDTITLTMLVAGWAGMLAGGLSGAAIGLFFHDERWMGGYGSFRRRLTRLGHISFFGLGFLNLLFAFTHHLAGLPAGWGRIAAGALLVGAVTMPACCFLSAWRKPFRHLFAVPVLGVVGGVTATLVGLLVTGSAGAGDAAAGAMVSAGAAAGGAP